MLSQLHSDTVWHTGIILSIWRNISQLTRYRYTWDFKIMPYQNIGILNCAAFKTESKRWDFNPIASKCEI